MTTNLGVNSQNCLYTHMGQSNVDVVNQALGNALDTMVKQMVSFRFKVPDLQEHFDTFDVTQSLLALEGALNIIFGGNTPTPALPESMEAEMAEDILMDREEDLTVTYVTAITSISEANGQNSVLDPIMTTLDDIGDTPLYQMNHTFFQQIVSKLSLEFNEDMYNQDIVTIQGEMMFMNRIELYSYNYDALTELLCITVTFE